MDKIFFGHLQHLKLCNYAESSIKARRLFLARFKRYLEDMDPLDVDKNVLDLFLARNALGPQGRANEISHLRGFYKWCLEENLIDVDPTVKIRRPKIARGLPRPMSHADLDTAIKNAPLRIRPWICLAAYAGLRACEIAQLKGEDLVWDGNPIIIIRRQKGGDSGAVPFSPRLQKELRHLPKRGFLFPKRSKHEGDIAGSQITASQVSHLSNEYLRSCGIESTFHSLRHWFGTEVYKASQRDLRRTQELMRHKTPVATSIYTYVDFGMSSDVVASLPDTEAVA